MTESSKNRRSLITKLIEKFRRGTEKSNSKPNEDPFLSLSKKASKFGIDKLYIILTFDCDIDEDIDAAKTLHSILSKRQIKAGYAVPGSQIEKSPETWRSISEAEGEFLNHGFLPHAEWEHDRYISKTFYNEMSWEEIEKDIKIAHYTLKENLAVTPNGFRAPHFGTFQETHQLDFLYKILRGLGYSYSTTTVPKLNLENGPIINMKGIYEIPLVGSVRYPNTLMDSWTYLENKIPPYRLREEYYELFLETLTYMRDNRLPGILPYYADPCHVVSQNPFEKTIDLIKSKSIDTIQGRDIPKIINLK